MNNMFDIQHDDKTTLLDYASAYIKRSGIISTQDAIIDFFGETNSDDMYLFSHLIKDIDHFGIYIGDYISQLEVDSLTSYLQTLVDACTIRNMITGPSYIVAKSYMTQGWWYNITLNDNSIIELFTCYYYGAWKKYPTQMKSNLMSHCALSVSEMDTIKLLVDYYHKDNSIDIVNYTENDFAGHTYCHLFNKLTNKVIEIIHCR